MQGYGGAGFLSYLIFGEEIQMNCKPSQTWKEGALSELKGIMRISFMEN
jgi:hypothetical protein